MKKFFVLLMLLCCLTGCAQEAAAPPATQAPETAAGPVTVFPLPVTLDPAKLDNCTVAVSLSEGDAYVDDEGYLQMRLTVYTYDLYDMAELSRLEEGGILHIRGKDIPVTSLEYTLHGRVLINGGLDMGGYELRSDDGTVYYESGYSDVKSWYPIGTALIPVSQDFLYIDRSDLDAPPRIYYPGDFLHPDSGIDYRFTPHNTTVTVQNGKLLYMDRVYTP